MKLTFTTTSAEVDPPICFTVEAATPIRCLALVEIELGKMFEPDHNLIEDLAFEAEKCFEAIEAGEQYHRSCFSTPEGDFTLTPTE